MTARSVYVHVPHCVVKADTDKALGADPLCTSLLTPRRQDMTLMAGSSKTTTT